jgi:hypothetical protein
MAFKIMMTFRKVFFGATMLGFLIWHSDRLPAMASDIINCLIPTAALLALINEIAYTLYLSFFFAQVDGEVIAKEDSLHHNIAAKNYEIKFEYAGGIYSFSHQDSIFGNTINSRASCQLLVHKRQPPMVFIDTFSHRYMYLIVSLFLLWSVYSVYKYGI